MLEDSAIPSLVPTTNEGVDQAAVSHPSIDTCDEPSRKRSRLSKKLHVAVAGCSHGEMDKIYASIAEIERTNGYKFDLLISCGDYQAVRNQGDLAHMHVNEKYRDLQTFHRYYSGQVTAPVLTIFVGGNHEASGYMQELPNGGWVAPNIFYMGHANVLRFAGLRIAGLSGIFNKQHYTTGHWERPPFLERGAVISAYHVRAVDVFRLKQLRPRDSSSEKLDIMVTHDWPSGITDYGDLGGLLRWKPYFKEDIQNNRLGNPATMDLLHEIRPRYWLAAHLHCKFAALVPHQKDADDSEQPEPTRFLSLDKPIPRRHFIQALEFDVDEDADMKLSYDPAWLAILKTTDFLTVVTDKRTFMPSQCGSSGERWDFRPTDEDIEAVNKVFLGDWIIPQNFRQTAPPHSPAETITDEHYYRNPQSTELCSKLGIKDLNGMLCAMSENGLSVPHFLINHEDSKEQQPTVPSNSDPQGEEFAEGCDFVIDRGLGSSPTYLNDFTAPKLVENSEDKDVIEANEQASDQKADDNAVEGTETEQIKVGSGVFRRRPVGLITEDD